MLIFTLSNHLHVEILIWLLMLFLAVTNLRLILDKIDSGY